jgi:glutaconate CoA-transferase, subunit B
VGFLGAAQIDKYGNINTTMIGGTYASPQIRLPGAGGAPEIATASREVWIILKQTKQTFVESLHFVTSSGNSPRSRRGAAIQGRGPTVVITDLGVLIPDAETAEFTLVALHPGITAAQAPRLAQQQDGTSK